MKEVLYLAHVFLLTIAERLKARKTMRQQLAKALTTIVQETEKTDHIPPITTNEANPFPYQVSG